MTLTPSEIRVIVGSATMCTFLGALEQSIVATGLPSISRDLGDFTLIPWVVTAYLLTSTCIMPVMGKLSDIYGRRPVLAVCLLLFLAGSTACALASSMTGLILSRALQGMGGGGLMALSQTIIADVVSPRDRGRYSAFFSSVWAFAAILGPSIGGVLTQYLGWPWLFWINLPFGTATLVVTWIVLRKLPLNRRSAPIDYMGIALLTSATVALLMVLSLGGKRLPWTSVGILGLGALGLLLAFAFLRQQRRTAEPIVPPRFLADRVICPAFTSSFMVHGSYLSSIVLTPIYFQVALGAPAAEAGVYLIPYLVAVNIATTWAGQSCRKTGHYRFPTLVSLPLVVLSLGLLAFYADSLTTFEAAVILVIAGLGFGPIFPCTMVGSQNAVVARDIGAVSGTMTFVRAFGGAMGIAVYSALLLGLISSGLPDNGQFASLEELARHELPPEARQIVARAFGIVFGLMAAGVFLGLLLFSRIEDRPLHGAAPPKA